MSKSLMAAFASVLVALAAGTAAFAQPAPSPSPAMSPKPAASASPAASPSPTATPFKLITLTGFGDAGFEKVAGSNYARFVNCSNAACSNGTPARVFDSSTGPFFDLNGGRQLAGPNNFANAFDLQNANLQLTLNGATFNGKIETSFGSDADVIASNGQSRSGFNITQGYGAYVNGPFTLTVGKFETLAGAEVIENNSSSNFNYTRSYLFGYAIPFTHTGARLTYVPNSKVTINVGANNGWDDWKFAGKKKTLEGNVTLTASPNVTFLATTYNGNDFAVPGNSTFGFAPVYTNRMLYDSVLTVKATSALTLVANYDNGTQLADNGSFFAQSAHWNGIAGYAQYQISPLFGINLRKETFHDINGFRTVSGFSNLFPAGGFVPLANGPRLQSNTATFAYSPNSNYLFRAEYRADSADQPVFTYNGTLATNIAGVNVGRQNQSTYGLEAVIKFP